MELNILIVLLGTVERQDAFQTHPASDASSLALKSGERTGERVAVWIGTRKLMPVADYLSFQEKDFPILFGASPGRAAVVRQALLE